LALVKDWPKPANNMMAVLLSFFEKSPRSFGLWRIGSEAARAPLKPINLYSRHLIVFGRLAGGLDPKLDGPDADSRYVVDANDGSRTDSGAGEGVLSVLNL